MSNRDINCTSAEASHELKMLCFMHGYVYFIVQLLLQVPNFTCTFFRYKKNKTAISFTVLSNIAAVYVYFYCLMNGWALQVVSEKKIPLDIHILSNVPQATSLNLHPMSKLGQISAQTYKTPTSDFF